MTDIRHNVVIKALPRKVFEAITTQEGLSSWWAKQTTAKPEVGYINLFVFGQSTNEMKITDLVPNKRVVWHCLQSNEEWIGTTISFDLEEKNGATLLRFNHEGWRAVTDFFAVCNYNWALFMKSLKTYCETGQGTPF